MPQGISTNIDCTAQADCLAQNVQFMARYYCAGDNSKKLSLPEAVALSQAGLELVVVYENSPTSLGYFSSNAGHRDGVDAYHYAMSLNQTAGSAIYFAVDYDADPSDVSGAINDYFSGVAQGFADAAGGPTPMYKIGVYGSGLCCQWLLNHNPAVIFTWLAESTGWNGSKTFDAWNMKQSFMTQSICSLKVDPKHPDNNDGELNDTQGDFGAFSLA